MATLQDPSKADPPARPAAFNGGEAKPSSTAPSVVARNRRDKFFIQFAPFSCRHADAHVARKLTSPLQTPQVFQHPSVAQVSGRGKEFPHQCPLWVISGH